MRITTHHIQDLANLAKLEYLPRLKKDMENNPVCGDLLQDRYDELEKLTNAILDDSFFGE